ncbi:NRDE family protein [Reichenbachiella agarivorans]|uniref:NRDE family protein n=1 Tax=Reichenbachiella agarivorans TaxID=2979464 RepID=A0ABY6CVN4_9BACT|nr:NRDE family protein [Reichenbachiella agarivorans]UXP33989.1 NRDE family protein [Reichenbachiella agarivorans]
MCTILFSWKNHPDYNLILASNRDEFYRRPTTPAHYWEDQPDILAGKDLIGGGTWMGVSKNGRFAALTNFRDIEGIDSDAPSRGKLTTDFLTSHISPKEYLTQIQYSKIPYNPFNLLVGDMNELYYYSNVSQEIIAIAPGIYGLSNGLFDESWPKVQKGKLTLSQLITNRVDQPETFLDFLQNKELAADADLPHTGVPYGMEKGLSALFIELPGYGTRCSTIILRKEKELHFLEKTYPLEEQQAHLTVEKFPII